MQNSTPQCIRKASQKARTMSPWIVNEPLSMQVYLAWVERREVGGLVFYLRSQAGWDILVLRGTGTSMTRQVRNNNGYKKNDIGGNMQQSKVNVSINLTRFPGHPNNIKQIAAPTVYNAHLWCKWYIAGISSWKSNIHDYFFFAL